MKMKGNNDNTLRHLRDQSSLFTDYYFDFTTSLNYFYSLFFFFLIIIRLLSFPTINFIFKFLKKMVGSNKSGFVRIMRRVLTCSNAWFPFLRGNWGYVWGTTWKCRLQSSKRSSNRLINILKIKTIWRLIAKISMPDPTNLLGLIYCKIVLVLGLRVLGF